MNGVIKVACLERQKYLSIVRRPKGAFTRSTVPFIERTTQNESLVMYHWYISLFYTVGQLRNGEKNS